MLGVVASAEDIAAVLSSVWEKMKGSIEASIMEVLAGEYIVNTFIEYETTPAPPATFIEHSGNEVRVLVHLGIDTSKEFTPGMLLVLNPDYRRFHALRFAHGAIFKSVFPDYMEQELKILGAPHYMGAKYFDVDENGIKVDPEGEGAIVLIAVPGVIEIDTEYKTLIEREMKTTKYPTYYYQFSITITNVKVLDSLPDWYPEIVVEGYEEEEEEKHEENKEQQEQVIETESTSEGTL